FTPEKRGRDVYNWFYVVLHEPNIIDTFKNKVDESWYNILMHSRPGFANEAFKLLQETPTLADGPDELFFKIFEHLKKKTALARSPFGSIGQLAMALSIPHIQDYSKGLNLLVTCHFGRVKILDGNLMIVKSDKSVHGETTSWKFETVFPPPKEDILLHLMIMGGKDYRGIYYGQKPFSFSSIQERVKYNFFLRGHLNGLFRWNDAKAKNTAFEADLTSSICLASRKNGVYGI
ncbi:hypothetical protein MP638_007115, partial [Amoeboaphelidium occidentale]